MMKEIEVIIIAYFYIYILYLHFIQKSQNVGENILIFDTEH